jgi:biotin operon repressor
MEVFKLARKEELLRQQMGVNREVMNKKIKQIKESGYVLSEDEEEFLYNIRCMTKIYPM